MAARVDAQVLLCIRPETIKLGLAPENPPHVNFQARVERQAFLGYVMRYWVRVGEDEWIVDQADPGGFAPLDGNIVISISPERVHVIPP